MFFGWLKGIIGKLLFWFGALCLLVSIIKFEEYESGGVFISLFILIIGSYLNYVSKQTVKKVDK